MTKKLSDMIKEESVKTDSDAKPVKTPRSKKSEEEEVKILNGMTEQVKKYGKRIDYDILQESYDLLRKLNLDVILTSINNYLKGYNTAYQNAKEDETSETKKKYENMIKEKQKIENLIKFLGL